MNRDVLLFGVPTVGVVVGVAGVLLAEGAEGFDHLLPLGGAVLLLSMALLTVGVDQSAV